MAIPLIAHVQVASQGLPIVAVLALWGRRAPAPYARLALWCLFLVASDILDLIVALLRGNNQFTTYVVLPAEVALTLWVLSSWEKSPGRSRLATVVAVLMALAVGGALLLTNPAETFDRWVAPALALIALMAALAMLLRLVLTSQQLLTGQDWFWITLGMALFWVLSVPLPPFADAILPTNERWVHIAYYSRACIVILSFLLMTWGVLCQRRQATRFLLPS